MKLASMRLAVAALAFSASIAQNGPAIPNGSKAEQKLSETCSQADIAKYGRPAMAAGKDGVAYGVSAPEDHFRSNEEISVYIWLSNQSSKTIWSGSCCESTFLNYIQLFDASGHRLASTPELQRQKMLKEGKDWVVVCSCSGAVMAYHTGFCGVIDSGTLNRPDTAYRLQPGSYKLFASEPASNSQPTKDTSAEPNTAGLTITIVP